MAVPFGGAAMCVSGIAPQFLIAQGLKPLMISGGLRHG
jgi:hypothetical protein